jgi:hypothetical protein
MAIQITPIIVSNYTEADQARILNEEGQRRELEAERFIDLQQSISDEQDRRDLFNAEIQLKRDLFDIYLKKTFPTIVGNKKISDSDVSNKERDTKKNDVEIKATKLKLERSKNERLISERNRLNRENTFKIIKIEGKSNQNFFEMETEIGNRLKTTMNKTADGLNDVQRIIRDMNTIELKLGRSVIPHRDFVESEESDFDSNTYTNPNDIFIKPTDINADVPNISKDIMLEELRIRLNLSKT